jgi:hypothetical protein
MEKVRAVRWAMVLALTVGATVDVHNQQRGAVGAPATVTKTDVQRWMKELSNWGRWGKDDQLGALNLITPNRWEFLFVASPLRRPGISSSPFNPLAIF